MSKKNKKQARRTHNKRTKSNANAKQSTRTSTSSQNKTVNSNQNGSLKNIANAKTKKKYIMTDKVKTIFTVVVCVVMVLAFAIPTGLSMIISSGQTTNNTEQVVDPTNDSVNLTGSSRNSKEAFDETGKFDNFLLLDSESNTHLQDLYDPYVTIDDVRLLAEREQNMNDETNKEEVE